MIKSFKSQHSDVLWNLNYPEATGCSILVIPLTLTTLMSCGSYLLSYDLHKQRVGS